MSSLFFSLPGGFNFEFKSQEIFVFSEREDLLLGTYIPGAELVEKPEKVDLKIRFVKSTKKRLIQKECEIVLYEDWGGELPLDFFHLFYALSRQTWLTNEKFPVHAACVGDDGYVLLVGHSGVGKTMVVLDLLKQKGMNMFSGNKTLLSFAKDGQIFLLSGTKTITAKTSDLKKRGLKKFSRYQDRTVFVPSQYTKEVKPIKAIAFIALNDGVQEKDRLESLESVHKLYPFFLDAVNADVVLCDGMGVLVSSVSKKTKKTLARSLKKVLEKIPVYSIKGSLSFVVKTIKKI